MEDEEAAQRELWTRMRNAVRDVLDQTTLADLLKHSTDSELWMVTCFIFNAKAYC